jgi:RimJ/RimL family protein N-acetyltransferase
MNTNIIFRQNSKVILRPVEKADLDKFRLWINDPEISQYIRRSIPLDENQEEDWFKGLGKKQDRVVFSVVANTKKRPLIGNVSLFDISWNDRLATLGIMIGDKRFQNQGFGSATIYLICGYLAGTLNIRKLRLSVYSNNVRAIRCYKKCGFSEEGVLHKHRFINGKYVDEILMAKFLEE